jgi:hypothetical protein
MEKEYEKEIEFLKSEVKRLQECVGSWRRLAQEKKSRKECVRERSEQVRVLTLLQTGVQRGGKRGTNDLKHKKETAFFE